MKLFSISYTMFIDTGNYVGRSSFNEQIINLDAPNCVRVNMKEQGVKLGQTSKNSSLKLQCLKL